MCSDRIGVGEGDELDTGKLACRRQVAAFGDPPAPHQPQPDRRLISPAPHPEAPARSPQPISHVQKGGGGTEAIATS